MSQNRRDAGADGRVQRLRDLLDRGYEHHGAGDSAAACESWLEAWPLLLEVAARPDRPSLDRLDEELEGVFNWVQDLEVELFGAGHHDPRFYRAGIDYFRGFLARFGEDRDLTTENMRRDLAACHAALGEAAVVDGLFEAWLAADPAWGWGWIGWADCCYVHAPEADFMRAEGLLERGLAAAGVRDRVDILDRMHDVYVDAGRPEQAEETARAIEREMAAAAAAGGAFEEEVETSRSENVLRVTRRFDFGEPGLPLEALAPPSRDYRVGSPIEPLHRTKVGRNEPCPCGSGAKFKRCCGR